MEENLQRKPAFELKNYLLKLIAYWYLFAISLFIGFVYHTIDSRFAVSNYSTNSTIVLRDDLQNTQAVVGALQLFDNRESYETEFGILKSYVISEEAIKELDFTISYFKDEFFRRDTELYKNSPFLVVLDTTKRQANYLKCYIEILSSEEFVLRIDNTDIREQLRFGQKFENAWFTFTIEKNESLNVDFSFLQGNEYYFFINDFNALVKQYQNSLNVDMRSPNSSILWLWTDGTVPERIVDYLNKVVDIYLRKSLEDKNRVVKSTIEFIDNQLVGVIDSLDDAENRLQLYKQNNKILDIDKEATRHFGELDKLYQEKKMLGINLAFYQYQLKDLDENKEITSRVSPAFLNISDPILESYIDQYQKLLSEKTVISYDVKKDFPTLDILQLKLININKEIRNHINSTIKAIEHNIREIDKKMQEIDALLQKIPSVERELQYIQRRFTLNDNIYTFLLQKRTEAAITMSSNSPGAKILDVARYENVTQNAPMPGANRTKTIVISIVIPLLIIAIKEFFNNKVIDKSEVERLTRLPILGSVSNNRHKDLIPVKTKPKSPISESFRLVKANFKYLLIDKQNAIISINSTVSGEGKTFCSVNIASLLALSNQKTLLIDVDLRKPKVHLAFDHPNIYGLSSLLVGESSLSEVIFPTHIENLYLIPSGKIPVNPAELIETDRMQQIMEQLRSNYDYIILDTPPVAHVADALILARYTDLNIFVVRQNYSSKNVLSVIEELNRNKRMKKMAAIINDVNPNVIFGLKYGYGFGYGYSYGYGYGTEGQGYYENVPLKKGFITKIESQILKFLKNLFS
jgi:tyrosine-protein kinase Etk/Wzc